MTMVCDRCNRTGIRWMPPWPTTHTECPHCGGINCQRAEFQCAEDDQRDEEERDCAEATRQQQVMEARR